MSPSHRITDFLEQWLRLTQRESQAIQKADWRELTAIQTAKGALKESLVQALDDWRNQAVMGEENADKEPFYRPMIDHLLVLETQNGEFLALRKQNLLEQKRLVEQAGRNLRMVRDSYSRTPALAWQAYS